jgi:hypothetical protein
MLFIKENTLLVAGHGTTGEGEIFGKVALPCGSLLRSAFTQDILRINVEPNLEANEGAKTDYNPYVTRLLTLHSQAHKNNEGTRGLDEIARFTYVETRLDLNLAPAIADGRFRLVVVTGNAGDGKTAFLQRVEDYFKSLGVEVRELPTNNGAQWEHGGLQFHTNYDGSQDEGDVQNDDVLGSFLDPFSGSTFSEFRAGNVRLIAITKAAFSISSNTASIQRTLVRFEDSSLKLWKTVTPVTVCFW